MKKVLAILLTLAVILAFAACGKTNNDVSDTDINTSAEATDTQAADTSAPQTDADSPAQIVYADFKERVANGETDVEKLAEEIIANEALELMGGSMPVEEGLLNGFDGEIKGFAKGAQFAPMIGTIPFVGYVFELADGADVEAFKTMLKDNANLRWNICTQADEMVCESEGNLVFFTMAPASLDA